jgi:hypothetical protein
MTDHSEFFSIALTIDLSLDCVEIGRLCCGPSSQPWEWTPHEQYYSNSFYRSFRRLGVLDRVEDRFVSFTTGDLGVDSA